MGLLLGRCWAIRVRLSLRLCVARQVESVVLRVCLNLLPVVLNLNLDLDLLHA